MNKHTRYNTSEKGRKRYSRYRASLKGQENTSKYVYAKMRSRLVTRITNKQHQVVELERILKNE
jgi:hypothetical protein